MDLSTCTPGQRHVVTTLDHPLAVAAGAGSGKTFTLTQRIAWSLLPNESGESALNSIDEVMAITYTNKAAAELRSRIKQQLLEEGLTDEALKVDNAWISTIHGMCSRLLREHALEFGIDPSFELMLESESQIGFSHALENTFNRLSESADSSLRTYLSSKPLFDNGGFGKTIEADVHALIDLTHCLPDGFDALIEVTSNLSACQILEKTLDLVEAYLSYSQSWKHTSSEERLIAQFEDAQSLLNRALSEGIPDFKDEGFDAEAFFALLASVPLTASNFHSKQPDGEQLHDYRVEYLKLLFGAYLICGENEASARILFARMVEEEYCRLKGKSKLDSDDLIALTVEQLDAHPELSEWCRKHFKLVMVDEFQDTNWVQVDLIKRICKEDFSNFCVVGDAQQSIYKFRGADVEVFFDVRDEIARENPDLEIVELPDNFRSHADILAMVDKVFSQNEFFGPRFLHLDAKGAVNNNADPVFERIPRIEFAICRGQADEERLVLARAIAKRFAALRDEGESPSSMVILLGAMSNASLYVSALREYGFQSMISGGSVLSKAIEVQLTLALLKWFANPKSSDVLLSILLCEPFYLDDVTLEALCHSSAEELRIPLAEGFLHPEESCVHRLSEQQQQRFEKVRACLMGAEDCACLKSASLALRRLFLQSGWAALLDAGDAGKKAQAANFLKALNIIEGLEKGSGLPKLAADFGEHLNRSKEAPGMLCSSSSEFVRIMTVHASKGLQFPHVALAELKDGKARGFDGLQKLGKGFACMCAYTPSNVSDNKKPNKLLEQLEKEEDIANCSTTDPVAMYLYLKESRKREEAEEAQRLLYVGMTRPVKSLITCIPLDHSKEISGKPLFGALQGALGLEMDESQPVKMIDYGGGSLAKASFIEASDEVEDAFCATASNVLEFRHLHIPERPLRLPQAKEQREFLSYTSLKHDFVSSDKECASATVSSSNSSATDFGTVFHTIAQKAILDYKASSSAVSLVRPSKAFVDGLASRACLSEVQLQRLDLALNRWFASDLAHELCNHENIAAELPFTVAVHKGNQELKLEGSIDALAFDGESGRALLVDYKTGGSSQESYEQCRRKHLLQAQCYAYALLDAGFTRIDACFVRVEQASEQNPGQAQTLRYGFTAEDRESLAQAIIEHRA